jgi:hypothetical protein
VGTSESGAQPPVGRTKIFSEGPKRPWTFANFFLHWTFWPGCPPSASENTTLKHACFDVVSGVTSEETRLTNFYFRTFSRDLVAPGHPWLPLPPLLPLPPPLPRRCTNKTDRGPTKRAHRVGTGRVHVPRVGWEDPRARPALCRAVRPMRPIDGPVRGWAPQNLARSPRSGALKYFPRDQNDLGLL